MRIFYEDSLLYGAEFFAQMGECQVFSHREITPRQLQHADVLLVRSTTKVNAELLEYADHLKFVGTATAGTNHVDQELLANRGIQFVSAAGCNATAVAEYVVSAILVSATEQHWDPLQKRVGIVGAGHVGSALAAKLSALGIDYVLCDPPLQDSGDPRQLVDMQAVMACDIISLHTPLIEHGDYPTKHMFDRARLEALRPDQLLINACRGEVLDNAAALALYQQGKTLNLVLDVWENEPDICLPLVPYVNLATAHIAGHTLEGKAKGTEILYQKLCDWLGQAAPIQLQPMLPKLKNDTIDLTGKELSFADVQQLALSVYDICHDNIAFKQTINEPQQFAYLRKHYGIRREFAAVRVKADTCYWSEALYKLGFRR